MDKKLDKFLSEYSNIEFSKVNKNIFEISGFPHYETVFNNVLAFFLDSSESHNFKNIVYKSFKYGKNESVSFPKLRHNRLGIRIKE